MNELKRIYVAIVVCCISSARCGDVVVVYTALDRQFSEPILALFEKRTGIVAKAVYDTEVDKSVGLVNKIRVERHRPRCDVFWNNEIINTLRLKKEGLLQAFDSVAAKDYPKRFKDSDRFWYGFAARARVLLVNVDLVEKGDMPTSIGDLIDPKWRGKCAVARPLAGTSATHAAALFATMGSDLAKTFFLSLKKNRVKMESGNKSVAQSVSSGRVLFGLTDTDDAMIEIDKGRHVAIVYPDSGKNQMGVLFIPNTLSIVKGAPNPTAAKALVEFLLSMEVETILAKSPSAQIPLNPKVKVKAKVKTPAEIKSMKVDFAKAASVFYEAITFIRKKILR